MVIKMKRKLLIIALSSILVFSLVGCETGTVQVNVSNSENLSSYQFGEFINIGNNFVYDSATRIVYRKNANSYGNVYVPYYAPNGLPYSYNPATNTFEEINN